MWCFSESFSSLDSFVKMLAYSCSWRSRGCVFPGPPSDFLSAAYRALLLRPAAFSPQEKISEDLRATLNAFLHRTGQHSSK